MAMNRKARLDAMPVAERVKAVRIGALAGVLIAVSAAYGAVGTATRVGSAAALPGNVAAIMVAIACVAVIASSVLVYLVFTRQVFWAQCVLLAWSIAQLFGLTHLFYWDRLPRFVTFAGFSLSMLAFRHLRSLRRTGGQLDSEQARAVFS